MRKAIPKAIHANHREISDFIRIWTKYGIVATHKGHEIPPRGHPANFVSQLSAL